MLVLQVARARLHGGCEERKEEGKDPEDRAMLMRAPILGSQPVTIGRNWVETKIFGVDLFTPAPLFDLGEARRRQLSPRTGRRLSDDHVWFLRMTISMLYLCSVASVLGSGPALTVTLTQYTTGAPGAPPVPVSTSAACRTAACRARACRARIIACSRTAAARRARRRRVPLRVIAAR